MPLNYIDQDSIEISTLTTDSFNPAGLTLTTNSNTTSALSGAITNTFSIQNNLSATEFQVIQNLQLAANQSIRNFDSTFGIILSQSTREIQLVFNQFNFSLDSGVLQANNLAGGYGYGYSGYDQSFIVPAGVRYVYAKLWGAGGGAGRAGGWSYGSNGGGGGHTRGVIPVTPGETLTLVLGRGGLTSCYSAQYGGGGSPGTNTDIQYCGLGGGYAGIFRGAAGVASNALLIAGGGGGGGSQTGGWAETSDGGGGGGFVGARGECTVNDRYDFAGTGGTQVAGGRAPLFGGNTIGSQFQGGLNDHASYGGGGGAGWWGGGGGYHIDGSGAMAGGGGGSGYIHSSVIFGGTYTAFSYTPAFFWDVDLPTFPNAATRWACGGLNIQNNVGACNESGGSSYLAIWW
jgi:hypothetical protein